MNIAWWIVLTCYLTGALGNALVHVVLRKEADDTLSAGDVVLYALAWPMVTAQYAYAFVRGYIEGYQRKGD